MLVVNLALKKILTGEPRAPVGPEGPAGPASPCREEELVIISDEYWIGISQAHYVAQ